MNQIISNFKFQISNSRSGGFSILEVLISIAIFSFILLTVMSFVFWMSSSNVKTKADADVLENAQRIMDTITYEVRGAKSIYTPTTTATQLSLETLRYLPTDETTSYIDFFVCGTSICLKKESQSPLPLNPDSVQVTSLAFSQVQNGSTPSIEVSLTMAAKNPSGQIGSSASVTLQSTIALRSY